MKRKKGSVGFVIFTSIVMVLVLIIGIAATRNIGKSEDEIMAVKAVEQLSKMVGKIKPHEATLTKSSIESNDAKSNLYQELPDIETKEVVVEPTTKNYIEIYSSPEKVGTAQDAWLAELAKEFNSAGGITVGGVQYTVKLRNVSSGQAVDYIASKKAVPDAFTPSNSLWVDMAKADGVNVTPVSESLVNNTAGICISNDKYSEINKKYGEVNLKSIVEATSAGELSLGYTNPFSSSAGLNLLVSTLNEYGNGNVFSKEAEEGFNKFQKNIPFVALTTQQMKKSAERGTFDAFVSEYQTFTNDPQMVKDYKFVPYGYVHDNPLVAVTTDSNKLEALKGFANYCSTDAAKDKASKYGFNQNLDYKCPYEKISGSDLVKVQHFYKNNKDSKPVVCVFVTDVSGSMSGEPINNLKSSLINAMQYINSENYVGIVSYSDDVTIELPLGQFNMDQQSYFKGAVESLNAFGGTATINGIIVAVDMIAKQLEKTPDAKPMIIVLSDGLTNGGYTLDEATTVIKGYKIPIITICYNMDEAGKKSLKEISDLNEGANLDAGSDDIMYQIKMLFNSSL